MKYDKTPIWLRRVEYQGKADSLMDSLIRGNAADPAQRQQALMWAHEIRRAADEFLRVFMGQCESEVEALSRAGAVIETISELMESPEGVAPSIDWGLNFRTWRELLRDSDLPAVTKLTGYVMSTYAEGSLGVYGLGREVLAEDIGKTTRTVTRCTTELTMSGFIVRVTHGNSYGPGATGVGEKGTFVLRMPKEGQ